MSIRTSHYVIALFIKNGSTLWVMRLEELTFLSHPNIFWFLSTIVKIMIEILIHLFIFLYFSFFFILLTYFTVFFCLCLGLNTTIVLQTKIADLLGVAGTDVPVKEIQKLMAPHKVNYCFTFDLNVYLNILRAIRFIYFSTNLPFLDI